MRFAKPIKLLLCIGASLLCFTSVHGQSADAEFSNTLNQIADRKLSIAQKEAFIANQNAEMESLKSQIGNLGDTKAAIPTMLDKMTAALEREVAADFPFDKDARDARITSLKTTVASETASMGEKYRKALNVYRIEVNYGSSIKAEKGNHPKTPTFREGDDRFVKDEEGNVLVDKKTGLPEEMFDGNYIRYGRTSFAYINNDGSSPLRYDLEARDWVPVTNSEALQIRRGVRVAYGEIAPNVIYAPVKPDS